MNHIIYHQVKEGVDCPDGIMAATIAARFFRFDVSEIASQFGGGGHRNAAGFRSKKN